MGVFLYHLNSFIEFYLGFYIGSRLIGLRISLKKKLIMSAAMAFLFGVFNYILQNNISYLGYRPAIIFASYVGLLMLVAQVKFPASVLAFIVNFILFAINDALLVPVVYRMYGLQGTPPFGYSPIYFLFAITLHIPLFIIALLIHLKGIKIINLKNAYSR